MKGLQIYEIVVFMLREHINALVQLYLRNDFVIVSWKCVCRNI